MINNDNSSPSALNSCAINSRSLIYSGQDLKVLKSSFSQLKKEEIIEEKKTWFDWFVDKTVDILIPPDSDSNGVIFFGSHEKFDDGTELEAHNHKECLDSFNGFDWDSISDEKIDNFMADLDNDFKIYLSLDNLSESLNNKIKLFIKGIGVDSENVHIRVLTDTAADKLGFDQETKGATTVGCLGLKKCIILLTRGFAREMEEDFNETHQFTIAHEVGHLVNEDTFFKFVSKSSLNMTALKISLALSEVGVLLIQPFDSCFSNILLGCSIGLLTFQLPKNYLLRKNSIQLEASADKFAASRSADIAKGGLRFFEEERNRDMEKYNDFQQALDKKIHEPNASFTQKIKGYIGKYIILPMIIDEDYEPRFGKDHPPTSTRIENIKSYL